MTATQNLPERVKMTFTMKTLNNMKHLKPEHTTQREPSVTMIPATMKHNFPTYDMTQPLKCKLYRRNRMGYAKSLIKIPVRMRLLHKYQDI